MKRQQQQNEQYELKREKHFYANKMTAASFHIFPSRKIPLFLPYVSRQKYIHAKKEEETFRLHVNEHGFYFYFFVRQCRQTLFYFRGGKEK